MSVPCTEKLMSIILKNKVFIFIISFVVASTLNAQNKIDSLLKVVNTSTNDSIISSTYFELAQMTYLNSPKKALSYVNLSSVYFAKYSSDFQYSNSIEKSVIYRIMGDLDSSIYYNNLVYSNALKNNLPIYLCEAYGEYGLISVNQNNFQKAIDYFQKQLQIAKKHKLSSRYAGIFNNIGIAYGNKGDWEMAKEYFSKSLKDNFKNNKITSLGNDYNNLGIVYIINHQLDSAKKYVLKGLEYRYKSNDSIGIGGSLNNLALLENEAGNFKVALAFADSAFKIASLASYKKLQVEIFDSYDQIYSKMGNYKMSYEYLKKKNELNALFEKEKFTNDIQQLESDIQLEQKQSQLLEKDLKLTKSESQKQRQLAILMLAVILIIALAIFLFYFFKNNKILTHQNAIISEQKDLIEEKHKDITDSITYAHRIQSSLIPSQQELNKQNSNIAILFQPRDIVSGDFYWYSKINHTHLFALADCTGHGVPGAFMSFIGINQLNTIVNEKGVTSPAQILNELKKGVVNSLNSNQSNSEKKDGMDIAMISFNERELNFSGANQSILILRKNELIELKGNKQPVGVSDNNDSFTEEKFGLQKSDRIVLYSDGVVDQFGGESGKKLKTRHFKAWLVETSELSLQEQKNTIAAKLNLYKSNVEQTDDITLTIIEV